MSAFDFIFCISEDWFINLKDFVWLKRLLHINCKGKYENDLFGAVLL